MVASTNAISYSQPSAQLWVRRRRRQRVLAIIVATGLVAAQAYGWLFVFGVV
jgi:hypothetical protein